MDTGVQATCNWCSDKKSRWDVRHLYWISSRHSSTPRRFRWVHCQLEYLAVCLPGRIRRALDELPSTLDGTYERMLREIPDTNCEFAQRLLLCVAVVSRPLRVEEMAELLAFDFEAGQISKFHEDWGVQNPKKTGLSTC